MGACRFLCFSLVLVSSCGSPLDRPRGHVAADGASTDHPPPTHEDWEPPDEALGIQHVAPNHGPVTGGNETWIQGTGFGEMLSGQEPTVFFGGRAVGPAHLENLGRRILHVRSVPPGEPGAVDVEVRMSGSAEGDESAVLPGGYTYDRFYLDPRRGTMAGGTRVSLFGTGTAWDESAIVTFEGVPARACTVLGATRIDCRTPPGEERDADVRVEGGSGAGGYDDLVEDAFRYYNSADPIGGGLGGGPIDGLINVTLLDAASFIPHGGAFVMVGVDEDTPYKGVVNDFGFIQFEGDDLVGPQQITAGCWCTEWTSFVEADARDVTIFLERIPGCDLPPGT